MKRIILMCMGIIMSVVNNDDINEVNAVKVLNGEIVLYRK